jgi:hypothetical protein
VGSPAHAAAAVLSPYAPPQSVVDAPASPAEPKPVSLPVVNPLFVAGIVLFINAAFGLLEMVITRASSGKGVFNSPMPYIIDIVVGFGLVQNKEKYRGWAIARAVLGLLVYSGIGIAGGDVFSVVFTAIYVAALLMMLIGQPSKGRLWGAVALVSVYFLLAMIGFAMQGTGSLE